ncbi:MAG: ABC transporter substrate-binding protein, partial [Myxococcota bacterium]
ATVIPPLIDELAELGAVGAVGPVISPSVGDAIDMAMAREIPLISPSSTAGSLAIAPDGGFIFRNAPNDNIQALVLASYLIGSFEGVGGEPVQSVHVLAQNDNYGTDLAGAFVSAFTDSGGTVADRFDFTAGTGGLTTASPDCEVTDPPTGDQTVAECLLQRLDEAGARDVVLVSINDAINLIATWNSLDPRPDFRWYFTDGARTSDFFDAAPDSILDMVGSAPTAPELGDALEQFEEAFEERFPGEDIVETAFTAQVWDGVHLLAAGLARQSADGTEFGGIELARAIRDVSSGPGVILHAGRWRDLLAAVNANATVDFDGAAGPSDFDNCGETVGPYEIWRVVDQSGAKTSVRDQFFEAREVAVQFQVTLEGLNNCPEF